MLASTFGTKDLGLEDQNLIITILLIQIVGILGAFLFSRLSKKIGNINFIISTSKEDHKASNRYSIVVETPINYNGPVQVGDTLLVHHNVFKYYNDMKGVERSGKSFFKDDLFFIDKTLHRPLSVWNEDHEQKVL